MLGARGVAPMRYTTSIDEVTKGLKIVSIEYYIPKEPSVNTNGKNTKTQSMGRYNMNADTLLFIASGRMKPAATS